MLKSLFNKVAGLTLVLKNICQRLLLHCTHTNHSYLSVLLYIQHLLPHHHCYYCQYLSMFAFGSNSKGFKEFKPGISFSPKAFHHCYFLFHVFSVFISFVSFVLLLLLIKRFFCVEN